MRTFRTPIFSSNITIIQLDGKVPEVLGKGFLVRGCGMRNHWPRMSDGTAYARWLSVNMRKLNRWKSSVSMAHRIREKGGRGSSAAACCRARHVGNARVRPSLGPGTLSPDGSENIPPFPKPVRICVRRQRRCYWTQQRSRFQIFCKSKIVARIRNPVH